MSTNYIVSSGSLPPEVAHIVSIWTEVLLYGVYTCLFLEAGYFMLRKRRENITSARVFLITTILMYMVSTAHVCLGLYRMLRAYVWKVQPPAWYFMDFGIWETIAHNTMLLVMTWLGDGLVIYRCWVVWNYNYWVIIFPVILLMFQIASNLLLLVWFTHPNLTSFTTIQPWMGTVYPSVFGQNVITTGLIAFKIWSQHRSSAANGVIDASTGLSLIRILRIIVESAAIYTVQLLILLILYPLQSAAQFIVQSAIIPSIGIVFVLIAVRVHFTTSRAAIFHYTTPLGDIPNWFADTSSTHSTPIEIGSTSGTADLSEDKYRGGVDIIPSASISLADNLSHQV